MIALKAVLSIKIQNGIFLNVRRIFEDVPHNAIKLLLCHSLVHFVLHEQVNKETTKVFYTKRRFTSSYRTAIYLQYE